MTQFMGTHHNKRDGKGRVSIPASFRAVLKAQAQTDAPISFMVRPSHKQPCIQGWPCAEFAQLANSLSQLPTFSEAQEDLALVLYADTLPLECDREGRVLLPEALVKHAGLGDVVTFLGLGRIFEIWEFAAAGRRCAEARARVSSQGLTLPPVGPPLGPPLAGRLPTGPGGGPPA